MSPILSQVELGFETMFPMCLVLGSRVRCVYVKSLPVILYQHVTISKACLFGSLREHLDQSSQSGKSSTCKSHGA